MLSAFQAHSRGSCLPLLPPHGRAVAGSSVRQVVTMTGVLARAPSNEWLLPVPVLWKQQVRCGRWFGAPAD